MPLTAAARNAGVDRSAGRYQRRRPEQTFLYRIVEQHYPAFAAHLAGQGRVLPEYVQREFEDYLQCGRLERGFPRVRCESCHAERLVAFGWPLLRIPAPAALVNPFASQTPWLYARAAGRGVWPRVRLCWPTRCCLNSPCASGY